MDYIVCPITMPLACVDTVNESLLSQTYSHLIFFQLNLGHAYTHTHRNVFKIVLVGDPNVGKTSLIMRYAVSDC